VWGGVRNVWDGGEECVGGEVRNVCEFVRYEFVSSFEM
jgi:hypothetical protein